MPPLLRTAAVAAVGVLLFASAAAASLPERQPVAARLERGADAVAALERRAGELCLTTFARVPLGSVDEQCRVRNALRRSGVSSIAYRGSTNNAEPTAVDAMAPFERAFCGTQTNVGGIVARPATNGESFLFSIDTRGRYVVHFVHRTPIAFFTLAGAPGGVVVTARTHDRPATTVELAAPDVGSGDGRYAFVAALPGGEFDELVIEADGRSASWCIASVGVPCATFVDDDDYADDDDDDDDDDDNATRHYELSSSDDACASDDDDDDDDDRRYRRGLPHSMLLRVTNGARIDAAASNVGQLCELRLNALDPGLVAAQRPHRLPHNGVRSLAFVGRTVANSPQALAEATVGEHAFCALADELGAVVVAQDSTSVFFEPLAGSGFYRVAFTSPVSHALVETVGNAYDVSITPLLDGRRGNAVSDSAAAASTTAGRHVYSVTAIDGVFDALEIRTASRGADDGGHAHCIAAVATDCRQLD